MKDPRDEFIDGISQALEIVQDIVDIMRVSLHGIVNCDDATRSSLLAIDALKYGRDRAPELKELLKSLEKIKAKI